jgi:hypothetical protein
MTRRWRRLLCRVGLHWWHYQDGGPRCARCGLWEDM